MRLALILVVIVGAVALSMCGGEPPAAAPTAVTTTTTTLPPPTTTMLAAKSCTLPPMPDCGGGGVGCCEEGGERRFDAEIRAAQIAVREDHPDWFKSNGYIRVSDVEYTQGVADKITELFGLCARGGAKFHREHSISPDEVAIKETNKLSQNVDIIIGSSRQAQRGKTSTCRPASF
jgi:hypothetical protein